jgi:hypothetical protein
MELAFLIAQYLADEREVRDPSRSCGGRRKGGGVAACVFCNPLNPPPLPAPATLRQVELSRESGVPIAAFSGTLTPRSGSGGDGGGGAGGGSDAAGEGAVKRSLAGV